jgi:DNA-binding PadR family transcriptional regulator
MRGERRGRVARGDIRGLLLAGLIPGPAHGYELMRRLERASGGAWSPSPGSVYPTLQLLEDEGLLTSSTEGGRKTYALTPAGQAQADTAAGVRKPWDHGGLPPRHQELREVTAAVHLAARQVGTAGSPEQIEKAIALMHATRQQLYRLLADD